MALVSTLAHMLRPGGRRVKQEIRRILREEIQKRPRRENSTPRVGHLPCWGVSQMRGWSYRAGHAPRMRGATPASTCELEVDRRGCRDWPRH